MIIASFWADSDTTLSGNITYSTNNDSSVLERAASVINASYPILASSFTPSYMFILTWIDVEYKRLKRDERDLVRDTYIATRVNAEGAFGGGQ